MNLLTSTMMLSLVFLLAACSQTSQKQYDEEQNTTRVVIYDEMSDHHQTSSGNSVIEKPEDKPAVSSTSGKVIELNSKEFRNRVHDYKTERTWRYKGDKPCIVDFYANWCAPCRRLAPILDELARQYADKIYIYKVNTDIELELTAAYGIQHLPTLLFCPMAAEPFIQVGLLSKQDLQIIINQHLLKNN